MGGNNFIWLFFSISGRVSRWAYFLATMLLTVIAVIPLYQFMLSPEESQQAEMWSFIFSVVFLGSIWPHIALSVKRLHDFGKEGFYVIALFIPVVSIIAFLVLCLFPGDAGANRFGQYTNAPQS